MRTVLLALCFAALAVALAGCAHPADRDEVAACASAAEGLATPVRLRVVATNSLPADAKGRPGVRLTLVPQNPDVALPWLVCRFADRGSQSDIVALLTAKGPVDETHVILLNRFWLGSDEARAAANDREVAGLLKLPLKVAYPLQLALNALPDAAVYGLLATAYSLIYV